MCGEPVLRFHEGGQYVCIQFDLVVEYFQNYGLNESGYDTVPIWTKMTVNSAVRISPAGSVSRLQGIGSIHYP